MMAGLFWGPQPVSDHIHVSGWGKKINLFAQEPEWL
jgi:hypothetical protein